MNILEFSAVIGLGSLLAGFLGALTGLGGGVVVVPMLALLFHVDIRYAIGASLVSVIATSSGAAAAYVREGYSNIRIGMFLETATTVGAIAGAASLCMFPATPLPSCLDSCCCTPHISRAAIAWSMALTAFVELADALAPERHLSRPEGKQSYNVTGVPAGFGLMFGAGVLSGLLGIGSGAVKVLAMDQAMKIPFKVSTTTSNFMIGVTAAASAGLYLTAATSRPGLAMPVMLGVLTGSLIGRARAGEGQSQSVAILVRGGGSWCWDSR